MPVSAPNATLSLRALWWCLIVASTGIVLWLTLSPQGSVREINLIPFAEASHALRALLRSPRPLDHPALPFLLVQVVGNVVVFIPIGFGIAGLFWQPGCWRTLRRVLILGFLLSLSIEVIQLTLPTRATDVDDVIFNTVGSGLGAGLLLFFFRDRRRGATRPAARG